MIKVLVKLFGASWKTSLAGILGGISIAVWPILQSAVNTQLTGVKVDWTDVLMGVVVAIIGYLSKSQNVTHAPDPSKPVVAPPPQPEVKILK
jgi:hypothetical protein